MTVQHGGDELGRIVERDRAWIEQDGRLVFQWRNVRSGELRTAPHATDPDGPADRRYLLGLLRECRKDIADWLVSYDDGTDDSPGWAESRALLARLAALEAIPAHAGEEETRNE